MSLSIFYYSIYDFLCCCHNFNPSLCRVSPFLLFYVSVSRPCRLSELPLAGPLGNDSKGPGSLKGKREKPAFFLAVSLRFLAPKRIACYRLG